MAELTINGKTTVKELQTQFENEIGGHLRVYDGRSEAPEDATLVSIGAKKGVFECRTSRTVGKFEEAILAELNLKVKVYTQDNWVKVLDGITLNTVKELPKQATKAKMEAFLSYQRDDKGAEKAEVSDKKSEKAVSKSEYPQPILVSQDRNTKEWAFIDFAGNVVFKLPEYLMGKKIARITPCGMSKGSQQNVVQITLESEGTLDLYYNVATGKFIYFDMSDFESYKNPWNCSEWGYGVIAVGEMYNRRYINENGDTVLKTPCKKTGEFINGYARFRDVNSGASEVHNTFDIDENCNDMYEHKSLTMEMDDDCSGMNDKRIEKDGKIIVDTQYYMVDYINQEAIALVQWYDEDTDEKTYGLVKCYEDGKVILKAKEIDIIWNGFVALTDEAVIFVDMYGEIHREIKFSPSVKGVKHIVASVCSGQSYLTLDSEVIPLEVEVDGTEDRILINKDGDIIYKTHDDIQYIGKAGFIGQDKQRKLTWLSNKGEIKGVLNVSDQFEIPYKPCVAVTSGPAKTIANPEFIAKRFVTLNFSGEMYFVAAYDRDGDSIDPAIAKLKVGGEFKVSVNDVERGIEGKEYSREDFLEWDEISEEESETFEKAAGLQSGDTLPNEEINVVRELSKLDRCEFVSYKEKCDANASIDILLSNDEEFDPKKMVLQIDDLIFSESGEDDNDDAWDDPTLTAVYYNGKRYDIHPQSEDWDARHEIIWGEVPKGTYLF